MFASLLLHQQMTNPHCQCPAVLALWVWRLWWCFYDANGGNGVACELVIAIISSKLIPIVGVLHYWQELSTDFSEVGLGILPWLLLNNWDPSWLLLNRCIPPDLSSIPWLIISPLCPVLSGIRENNTLVTQCQLFCLCICNLCLCVFVTVFVFVFCIRLYSIFGPHVLVRPVSCSVRMKLFPNCFSSPPPRPKPRACPSKSPGTALTHHTH